MVPPGSRVAGDGVNSSWNYELQASRVWHAPFNGSHAGTGNSTGVTRSSGSTTTAPAQIIGGGGDILGGQCITNRQNPALRGGLQRNLRAGPRQWRRRW